MGVSFSSTRLTHILDILYSLHEHLSYIDGLVVSVSSKTASVAALCYLGLQVASAVAVDSIVILRLDVVGLLPESGERNMRLVHFLLVNEILEKNLTLDLLFSSHNLSYLQHHWRSQIHKARELYEERHLLRFKSHGGL